MPPKTPEYYFDETAADKVCKFFEKYLKHSKGREFAGKPFILEPWQSEFLRNLFGWKRKSDGFRKYRTAYLEIPRKNGKSTMCAGIALYLLFADQEPGAEVYSAAAATKQAALVFDEAKNMVLRSPALSKRGRVYRRSVVHNDKLGLPTGKYEVLSADADTQHGLNASGIVIDELHAQPNRELWDVLTTSTGSRTQPLTVTITTAGYDRNSICWEQHAYTQRLNDPKDSHEDDTFLGLIYAAGEDEAWDDPEVWKRCNPNLGVSLKLDYLKQACRKAKQSPAYENTFRRLHLNQWTEQETRFIPMDEWDACDGEVDAEKLKGRICYAGLDLASRHDLTALVLVFPPTSKDEPYFVLPQFWIPQDGMRERIRQDRVPYDVWVREGFVKATSGNTIDQRFVRAEIERLNKDYNISEVAFDRWGAVEISTALSDAGFTMVEFGQGVASMSAPTKEMLALVLARKIAHGDNPVLRWNASAVTVKQDAAGNIKPVKPDRMKSANRIDGIVALIMGLDRAMRNGPNFGVSIYEHEPLLVLEG